MKKLLIAMLAATGLSTPACANQAADSANTPAPANQSATKTAARPDVDPAMWVVRDQDTTIYLFGTVHLLDGKSDWFNDEVKEAFDKSQELVFEVILPENQAELAQAMGPLVMKYAIDPNGKTLSSRLTPEQNKKFNDALAGIGAPAGAFDRFEPWFASMSLSAVSASKLGLKEEHGAETVLKRAAKARNMTLGQVETLEGQLKMLDGMPEEQQIHQLRQTLDNLEQVDKLMPKLLTAWNNGNPEELDKVMNEGMSEMPGLREALLGNRNKAWAEWIDQRLDKPGTVFMAVGAGHLAGPDSVQAFLAQRNIQSARVSQKTGG